MDQKNPLQSGSSKMYGTNRVNRRTQFRTETKQKSEQKKCRIYDNAFNSQIGSVKIISNRITQSKKAFEF